ncbi:MAG: rRNA maturation RNase YbeY [Candidatus Pacebacteria bacterium]|nr:rRNA maturation RNase YbeY [Candidatus Paceibacterota bacterium]MDD5357373.1 rRNA maturation RNase YbeY [Candidatus Paceibacterota bacterium]
MQITNKTKSTFAKREVLFSSLKDKILGKNYDLSLVFIGPKESQSLNNKFRGKNKPTNILSFSLSKTSGEIFITPSVAKKEAPRFGKTFDAFLGQLLIHGLFHLKGMEHGGTMERAEAKIQRHFGI